MMEQPEPAVAVVIPVHNRRDKTVRCLRGLARAELASFRLSVIIVDAGSTDGTSDAVRTEMPSAEILSADAACFWTECVNRGIARALALRVQWVLVLNDDTVHDSTSLRRLIKTAMMNPEAIISPKILYLSRPNIVRFAGAAWSLSRLGWFYPHDGCDARLIGEEPFDVDSINGNCCLIPISVIRKYGMYDAIRFPHCYADSAYTIRVRRLGVRLLVDPGASVWDDDSDKPEKVRRPPFQGLRLFRAIFGSKRSAYNIRAMFAFHFVFSKNRFEGAAIWAYKNTRMIAKVAMWIASDAMTVIR